MSPEVEKKERKLRFYGEADLNRDGKIKSDYPSWYHRQHTEDLDEGIKQKERALGEDLIPDSEKPLMRSRLKQERELSEKISSSYAETKGFEDTINKGSKELEANIKEFSYSRSQMDKGVADPHEEARRISEPIISVKSKEVAELCEAAGIKPRDGKITRGEAEKIWKISRRAMGEMSNTESLRKP